MQITGHIEANDRMIHIEFCGFFPSLLLSYCGKKTTIHSDFIILEIVWIFHPKKRGKRLLFVFVI